MKTNSMSELNDLNNIQDTFGNEKITVNLNAPKNIYIILSFISWIFLFSCQLNSTEYNIPLSFVESYCIQNGYMDNIQAIYNSFPQYALLIIILIGFIIYLIYTVYQRDQAAFSGLFNNFAKFHFLPLFLVSSLYIMNESIKRSSTDSFEKYNFVIFIFNSISILAGLVLLIIVYIKTKLNCQWYVIFFIKKGVYSSLIMVLWSNIFLNIFVFLDNSIIYSFILIPIGRGIGAIIFSLVFKDIMILFINMLYDIRTLKNHYTYHYLSDSEFNYEYIPLIMIIITLGLMIGLIAKCKHKLYEA